MMLFRRAAALPATISAGGRIVPLVVVRAPRARGLRLYADATRGVLRLTLPPRGTLADARRLLDGHGDWIAAQVLRWPQPLPVLPGARVPFDGGVLAIEHRAGASRGVQRLGDRLIVGGDPAAVPGRVLRWLRASALADLDPASRALASSINCALAAVAVRDPAARWGSCIGGSAPRIGYSWRLIMAPGWVRHSVVAHEVAHLVHANHGPAFWRLAADLNGGDPATARAWLRRHGTALHWVGRVGDMVRVHDHSDDAAEQHREQDTGNSAVARDADR